MIVEVSSTARYPRGVVIVDGDHVSSIKPALDAWLAARRATP